MPWWCMHVKLDGHTQFMHCYQESLIEGPPWFGDLENSLYDLVTISKLQFSLHAFTLMIFFACSVFNAPMLNVMLLDM